MMDKKKRLLKIVLYAKYHLAVSSDKDLAQDIGFDKTNISKALSGDESYMKSLFNKIDNKIPGVFNADWYESENGIMLVNDEKQMTLTNDNIETRPRIPLNAAAGSISVALDGVTNDDSEQLPFVSAFSNYNYTILVKGDSMEPEFMSGDELACLQLTNGKARFIQWGRYHVLDTAQGVVVKRIYDNGEYILCKSENKELYPDFQILKEDIYNIGLVIGMLRRY